MRRLFLLLISTHLLLAGGVYAGLMRYREAHADNYTCLLYGRVMLQLDTSLHVYDYRPNYTGEAYPHPYSFPEFSPDGRHFFAVNMRTGEVFIEEVATGEQVVFYQLSRRWYYAVWEPSGRGLMFSDYDYTGQTLQLLLLSPGGELLQKVQIPATEFADYDLSRFSFEGPPGYFMLALYEERKFYLLPWDGSPPEVQPWPGQTPFWARAYRAWAWSPDYQHLAYWTEGGVAIWERATGQVYQSGPLLPPGRWPDDYTVQHLRLRWLSPQNLIAYLGWRASQGHLEFAQGRLLNLRVGPGGWGEEDMPLPEWPLLLMDSETAQGPYWDYVLTDLSQTYENYLYRYEAATGQNRLLLSSDRTQFFGDTGFFFQQQGEEWGYYRFTLGGELEAWQSLGPYLRPGPAPDLQVYTYQEHDLLVRFYYGPETQNLLLSQAGEVLFNSDDPQWAESFLGYSLMVKDQAGDLGVYDDARRVFHGLGALSDDYLFNGEVFFLLDSPHRPVFLLRKQAPSNQFSLFWGQEGGGLARHLADLMPGRTFYDQAFSPDGRYLAWSEWDNVNNHLHLRLYDFERGELRELGGFSTEHAGGGPVPGLTWTRCRPAPLP
jgi:hypothetical protein